MTELRHRLGLVLHWLFDRHYIDPEEGRGVSHR